MKVVILSLGVPSKEYPLNGIFAFDQAKALSAAGVEVVFLSIDLRSIRRRRKLGYTFGQQDGILWYNISIPIGPIYFLLRIVLRFAAVAIYKKAFTGHKPPDLIHAHFGEVGGGAMVLKKKFGIPFVLTEHSSEVNKIVITDRKKKKIREIYSNADRLIAVSKALANNIMRHTSLLAYVIPNIVQTEVFQEVIKKAHNGFRLVTTSNLIHLKRTALIIDAISELNEEIPDIHLDIIGDGNLRVELEQQCYRKGLKDKIIFHGILKREEIAEIYSVSDCFILVSSTETFGVSYVEAMAAGLPVIGTKCGGPEDFINEQNGLLIEVDNIEQIKWAIREMHLRYKSYSAQELRKFVNKRFSPEVIANKNITIYKEIVNL